MSRIKYNADDSSLSITPVELYVKGNIVANGTKVDYAGNGVWSSEVDMNDGNVFLFSEKYFYFAFNNDDNLAVKRLNGSRTTVAMPSEGFTTNNIRLNRGTYTLTLDMRNYSWSINAPIDENRISAFGSSVCNGQGATGNKGYAYLYGQLQSRLYNDKQIDNPFTVSGISIGGNTTVNLLNRYDEMLHDFGRYVVFGLSLGNEGIHEATDKSGPFNQWRDNMLTLISKAKTDGKIPVVMNNYTRGDFTAEDYNAVKQLNLLIHEWDVPSVNTLGAIDNGAGHWADGYQADNGHPTTEGHQEFFYAVPPTLFEALAAGKTAPVRDQSKSIELKEKKIITFTPEENTIVHPFALSVRMKGSDTGNVMKLKVGDKEATIAVNNQGKLVFTSINGETIEDTTAINDDQWHTVTLSQYFAQKRLILYVDGTSQGELSTRFAPTRFIIGDDETDSSRTFSELFFWRSALNPEEVAALCEGKMLKSSLEIYAPLSEPESAAKSLTGTNPAGIDNLAQSLNTIAYTTASEIDGTGASTATAQTIYIDFGEPDSRTDRGETTSGIDQNGNYWTNIASEEDDHFYPSTHTLINAAGTDTGYKLKLNTRFMSNGKSGGGGLQSPDAALLGDLAVTTATEDYIFAENFQDCLNMSFTGLDRNKAYRFHIFGSRVVATARSANFELLGENSWTGFQAMSGTAIGDGGYNGNNNNVLESDPIFPDVNGCIHLYMRQADGDMCYINAMKIVEDPDAERPNSNIQLVQRMYIDFGKANGTSGRKTEGADANGNYWTNVYTPNNNDYLFPGFLFPIVNSNNEDTGYNIMALTRFHINGKSGGGGLESPSADLLGDMAIASATEDYIHVETFQDYDAILFSGLNPEHGYRFYTFGSRTDDNERTATFIFSGENEWSAVQENAGKVYGYYIGAGDYNANNANVIPSDIIFPLADGTITLYMVKKAADRMIHLNAMKIEEFTGYDRPHTNYMATQTMLIDFGEIQGSTGRDHGYATDVDQYNRKWNNIYATSNDRIPAGSTYQLVNTANQSSGITATLNAEAKTNGTTTSNNSGGLTGSNFTMAKLRDLDVETATTDYVYLESNTSTSITFSGLDPAKRYRFSAFGCRVTTTNRICWYIYEGANTWKTKMTTSANAVGGLVNVSNPTTESGIGRIQGNIYGVPVSQYIAPTADGKITFTLQAATDLAHINMMKIEECVPAIVIDEQADNTEIEAANNAVVQLKRTFAKDTWNTLCLPFALDATQTKALLGDNVQVAKFSKAEADKQLITFVSDDDIDALVPCLVMPSIDVTEPVFLTDITLVAGDVEECSEDGYAFTGTLKPTAFTAHDPTIYYVASGNKLKHPANTNPLKALRAYFSVPATATGAKFVVDDSATGINTMNNSECVMHNATNAVYDLQGRRVADNPSSFISHPSSRKGIYIVNGKKVIIK